MALLPSGLLRKPLAVTQPVQREEPGCGSPEWEAAIVYVISKACAVPAVTS